MHPRNAGGTGRGSVLRTAVLAAVVLAGWPVSGSAQVTVPPASPAVAPLDGAIPTTVIPASCTNCSLPPGGGSSGPGVLGFGRYGAPAGCGGTCDLGCADGGCGEGGCVPGRGCCEACEGQTRLTRLLCGVHNALCCPDPCYEPQWIDAANAALFVPSVRPSTYVRYRWDSGHNLTQPDRGEYFWAAIGKKGPGKPETHVNYNELSVYAEVGTSKFSFFIDTPYRNLHGDVNGGAGSFGDLSLGTKSVILDSELVLSSFQFRTTIPTGNPANGTGTGHVSLEPSLLWTVKLYPETYWQSQLGYWIPIGGTPGYAGSVLIYNNTLNHVLCRPMRDTALIGTIESSGWTFTAGGFTDPITGLRLRGNNTTYFNLGPGLRLSVCDKLDVGFGVQFALTTDHFAQQLYRTELRWRF